MTVVTYPLGPESALIAWAKDAREAHAIAQSLAKTAFVSSTLRGKPEEVTGAILSGHEVGLPPMAAVRSIDVIQGTPAMRAVAMRALLQSKGHRIRVVEQTTTRAKVIGWRTDESREDAQESVWTIDRAKRLGLTGKDNWVKQPEAMLVARATAECCRLVASDVLLGLAYAVEELDDEPERDVPVKRTAKRKPIEKVEHETPALEPPTPEPDVEQLEPDPVASSCEVCGAPEGAVHDVELHEMTAAAEA